LERGIEGKNWQWKVKLLMANEMSWTLE